MKNSAFIGLLCLCACSPKSEIAGKRVSLAKGNVSFILPDSSLVYNEPVLWPADFELGSYGEAGGFYHNQDSTVIVSIYVSAYPNSERRKLPWRVLADEKGRRDDLLAKNRNLAVIERFVADSSERTIIIDYHMPQRAEEGRRGQASFEKDFAFYGPQRTIHFWFFAPDNAVNRQAIAASCASVRVNPTYLQAGARLYPAREYWD